MLDITIEAEHVVKEPGEFYLYAKKYLIGIIRITKKSESWSVKSVSSKMRVVSQNNSERYLMQLKPGYTPYLDNGREQPAGCYHTEMCPVAEGPCHSRAGVG